jgi:tol-pal system protein YbgF
LPEVEFTLKKYALTILSGALLSVVTASPAFGVSREIIQMMQQLDTLQQSVQTLQNTVSTQTAILHTLLQQTSHDVTLMKSQMADLQKYTEQNLAASSSKVDSMSTQIQALSSSLEQAQGQLTRLSEQLAQTQKVIQTLNAPPAAAPGSVPPGTPGDTPSSPTAAAAPANVPDPNSLFNSAMGSFNSGQYALAVQGFQEFLQYYGTTPRASTAQYYIGECYYNNGDYKHAVEAYDKCIERYPNDDKTLAARLKKGYALLANGDKAAGIRELRALVEQHPQSHESELASQRLRRLGITIRTGSQG